VKGREVNVREGRKAAAVCKTIGFKKGNAAVNHQKNHLTRKKTTDLGPSLNIFAGNEKGKVYKTRYGRTPRETTNSGPFVKQGKSTAQPGSKGRTNRGPTQNLKAKS